MSIDSFIAEARRALPGIALDRWGVRTFGNSAEMADVLVGLIQRGEKTGTFSPLWEFAATGTEPPAVGDHFVVTAFDGTPRCLYEVERVDVVPYERIGPEELAIEGPRLREIEPWRAVHWPYFGAMLRKRGREPALDMPIVVQRFRVVYPR